MLLSVLDIRCSLKLSLNVVSVLSPPVPSRPRITRIRDQTNQSLEVVWEAPDVTNGRLIQYVVYWVPSRHPPGKEEKAQLLPVTTRPPNTMSYVISQLSMLYIV